ncbi:substrate-binding domain-containing protein [Streptomyces sp. NPDC097704]|uniref:substrate-binding domain-containing protein n=1 Tax=Streptomyces sp. NPDC097704 TaxID=3157101 RepID=UPI0033200EA1
MPQAQRAPRRRRRLPGGPRVPAHLRRQKRARPDAVFCLTGRHAAGVQRGLLARGVRVPEETLVVTGSDSEHARNSRPAVSALELNPVDSSAALLDILQSLIAGRPADAPRLTRARFRPRASTRR